MVSDTHCRWFIFTVYICEVQVMVSDARWIIEIHCVRGAVAADLSMDGRRREWGTWEGERERERDTTEIRLSSLSFLTWRGRPLGPPFSRKWTERTHRLTNAYSVAGTMLVANQRDNVHKNDGCPSGVLTYRRACHPSRILFKTNVCESLHNFFLLSSHSHISTKQSGNMGDRLGEAVTINSWATYTNEEETQVCKWQTGIQRDRMHSAVCSDTTHAILVFVKHTSSLPLCHCLHPPRLSEHSSTTGLVVIPVRDVMPKAAGTMHRRTLNVNAYSRYTEHQLSYGAIVLELLIPETHLGSVNVYVLLEGILQCIIFLNISVASLY